MASLSLGEIAGIRADNSFFYLCLNSVRSRGVGSPLALSLDANPCSLLRQKRRSRSHPALRQKNAQSAYAVPGRNWSSFAKAGTACWKQIHLPPSFRPRSGWLPGGKPLDGTRVYGACCLQPLTAPPSELLRFMRLAPLLW